MTDRDRRRILERRALFLSSSLAVLSCGPKPPAEAPPGSSTEVAVPEQPTEGPKEDLVGPAPDRVEDTPDEPTMEIPDGVSERAQQNYERLFKMVRGQLATIATTAKKVPAPCDVAAKDCEAQFRSVADSVLKYHESTRFSYFCPGSSDEAKEFEKKRSALTNQVRARYSELISKIEKALSDGSADGKKEWQRLEQEAAAANPHPCLSFACEDW